MGLGNPFVPREALDKGAELGRSLFVDQQSGVDEMIGLVGTASTALSPEGKVFIRGEYWTVEASESIPAGEDVEVIAVNGLKLRVKRATDSRQIF